MESLNNFINFLEDLNLNLDHEGLSLLQNYLEQEKRIGIIGISSDFDFPVTEIKRLSIHPDLFDQSKYFSNLTDILPELEENFDLLLIMSNKEKMVTSNVPIIRISPNNLYLELNGNPDSRELIKWLQEININLENIQGILSDNNSNLNIFPNENLKILPLNYFSLNEKNEYLTEESRINNQPVYLFEKPIKPKKEIGKLNYFELINENFLTLEEKSVLNNSDIVFIENSLSEIKNYISDKEIISFDIKNLNNVLNKILDLINKTKTVSLVYSLVNSSEVKTAIYNILKNYEDYIFPYSSLKWLNLIETTFNLDLSNYIKLDLDSFLNMASNVKIFINELFTIIIEIRNLTEETKETLFNKLNTFYEAHEEIMVFNTNTEFAYKTTLEFLEISEDISYLII